MVVPEFSGTKDSGQVEVRVEVQGRGELELAWLNELLRCPRLRNMMVRWWCAGSMLKLWDHEGGKSRDLR